MTILVSVADDVLWDNRLDALQAYIDTTKVDYTQPYWRIKAAWVTVNGNWDDVPAWAKQYQKDTLGGDHHAFGLALFKDGQVAPGAGFSLLWPDDSDNRTPEPDGWANIPLYAGFNPANTYGPYCWQKLGNAERLVGLGMPYSLPWLVGDVAAAGGHHVSWFVVWQETEPATPPVDPPVDPPVEPPVDPPVEPPDDGEWVDVEVDVAGLFYLPNVRVRRK